TTRAAEERKHLIADPLGWRDATGSQAVRRNGDVVRRRGRRDLALGRGYEANAQRFGQVADAGEEPRRMWRPIELQPGEIVMMHPLVEQRLEKDFGREDLLPNRREVVDPDGTALGSRFPRDPVVAVGFDFQFAFAGTVALRAVGHSQLAGWQ